MECPFLDLITGKSGERASAFTPDGNSIRKITTTKYHTMLTAIYVATTTTNMSSIIKLHSTPTPLWVATSTAELAVTITATRIPKENNEFQGERFPKALVVNHNRDSPCLYNFINH